MELFKISCMTCQASLSVHDESLLGQIVACPRCGSMVEVQPPVAEPQPATEVAKQEITQATSGPLFAAAKKYQLVGGALVSVLVGGALLGVVLLRSGEDAAVASSTKEEAAAEQAVPEPSRQLEPAASAESTEPALPVEADGTPPEQTIDKPSPVPVEVEQTPASPLEPQPATPPARTEPKTP
ncbi:MAG: hypothetical protein MI725_04580, partial [Pirellulales bacterium]|nr:hypothetical protein [Pirellulales bacterium]